MAYVPGQGVQVSKNGELKTLVPGLAFKEALFGIWLGKEPADDDLKDDMLGKENFILNNERAVPDYSGTALYDSFPVHISSAISICYYPVKLSPVFLLTQISLQFKKYEYQFIISLLIGEMS